jgi:glycosyltransferase involved in cell wall biosynthesis
VASIRRAGFKNPIALVPNGVNLPATVAQSEASQTLRPARALFLSRIHPKKGLLNLIDAWARVRPSNWELCIAGPDQANHLSAVSRLVHAHGLQHHVRFLGELWGEAKTRAFLESDFFVLPSFSENFGLVIAEALAHSVPVITTQATPWRELRDHSCGWWIELGVEPLAQALQHAFAIPGAALREMGGRGRKLVDAKYRWEPIGRSMLEVYQWMLSHRDKPEYVLTL